MKKQGVYGIIVVLLCFVFTVWAQESQDEKQATSDTQKKLETMVEEVTKKVEEQKKQAGDYALEIDGLIIDETKTKIGRDFYDLFYSSWEAPIDIKNYTIHIYERAHPRFGSWVWITVNETMVYQNVLRPRYDVIEDASRIGINATRQFLYRRNQDQRQLLGQDMSGTGVY